MMRTPDTSVAAGVAGSGERRPGPAGSAGGAFGAAGLRSQLCTRTNRRRFASEQSGCDDVRRRGIRFSRQGVAAEHIQQASNRVQVTVLEGLWRQVPGFLMSITIGDTGCGDRQRLEFLIEIKLS
jgi:hypothetical protein